MYEDRPEKDTPQNIIDELTEYGGCAPDGKTPIWRLVLAQNCRIHCFGRFNEIANRPIADDSRPTDLVPDRIYEGEGWVPRYKKVKGWILQRWFPPSTWGTRESWEGQRAQDGRTRLLAAFPQAGDYKEMPVGPWKTIAEVGDLKAAIRCYNAQQRANPVNWTNWEQAWIALDALDRQRAADAFAEEGEARYRMGISPVLRTVSGSASVRVNSGVSIFVFFAVLSVAGCGVPTDDVGCTEDGCFAEIDYESPFTTTEQEQAAFECRADHGPACCSDDPEDPRPYCNEPQ